MIRSHRFGLLWIVVFAASLMLGAFLLFAGGGTAPYALIAGFYLGPTAALLLLFEGVEAAPRWAWYIAYFGGVLFQNAVLVGLFVWLYRKLTLRSSRRPSGAAHL